MKTMTKSSTENKKVKKTESTMPRDQLQKLLEDGIKDLYWAEKKMTQALPGMIRNASSPELSKALQHHLVETEGQVKRLESVFDKLDMKPSAKKCEAMEGLVKEGEEIMGESTDGMMMDAGIIAAGQKIEHYEIASYGTLAAFAERLGHSEVNRLLSETLAEEKAADIKLTELTFDVVRFDN